MILMCQCGCSRGLRRNEHHSTTFCEFYFYFGLKGNEHQFFLFRIFFLFLTNQVIYGSPEGQVKPLSSLW